MAPRPPTGAWSYRVHARAAAAVDDVWTLIGEAARWKDWSFLGESRLEVEGEPRPDGVGAVRRFTRMGVGSRERVVAWEPPTRLGYEIVSGFPVRSYRADIVLGPAAGGGTDITWSGRFEPLVPGTGRMLRAVLQLLIGRFVRGLVAYAERPAGR